MSTARPWVSPAVRHYHKQVAPLLSHAPLRYMILTGKSCDSVDALKMRLVLRMVQLRCNSPSVAFALGF
jgi:enoyl-CoA hydratase/carnithine racemase